MSLSTLTSSPWHVAAFVAAVLGIAMLVHATAQIRLLRRRIAMGTGTAVFDTTTGFFAADAAWHCIRAEANRAHRLGRPLRVWVGHAQHDDYLDSSGRALAFDLPAGATTIRLDASRLCVVSCAHVGDGVNDLAPDELHWTERTFPGDDETARRALAFVAAAASAPRSEVVADD